MRACPHCRSTYVSEIEFCGIDGTRLVDADVDPLIGQTIDRYQIVERLGAGAMAAVYRAKHVVLERDFAIKVLFGELAANRTVVARFRREAQALSKVRHTNIISVIDFGVTDRGLPFLIMDYVQGASLADVIALEAPLDPRRAARITRQTASALAEVHRIGLIHRDVKPANLLLVNEAGEEVVKLLDFGIVAVEDSAAETKLTATGKIVGTPIYMAPEQGQPGAVTQAVDLYALGVILYQMLAGKPPFDGNGLAEVLVKHAVEPPPPLPYAMGLEQIAHWLLMKDPFQRPASGAVVVAELDALGFERTSPPPAMPSLLPPIPPSLPPFVAPSQKPIEEAAFEAITDRPAPSSSQPSMTGVTPHPITIPESPNASLMSAALATSGDSDLPLPPTQPRFSRIGPITGVFGLVLGAIALAIAYFAPLRDPSPARDDEPSLPALAPPIEPAKTASVAQTKTSSDAQQAVASLPRLERKLRRAIDKRGLSENDLRAFRETAWLFNRWRLARDEGREADAAVAAAELLDAAKSLAISPAFLRGKLKRFHVSMKGAKITAQERSQLDGKAKDIAREINNKLSEENALKLAVRITRLEEELERRTK